MACLFYAYVFYGRALIFISCASSAAEFSRASSSASSAIGAGRLPQTIHIAPAAAAKAIGTRSVEQENMKENCLD